MLQLPLLSDQDLAEIAKIGEERRPCEAVGVILPQAWGWPPKTVWEMPNRSKTPHDQSQMLMADLRLSLGGAPRDLLDDMIIWHTHPQGNIGPSRQDLRSPIVGVPMLVIALTPEGAVPTLYEPLGAKADGQ